MSLIVTIYSFGYRLHGIPADATEHRGGFVFDCRCLPNPGRRTDFAQLTGRDAAVRTYLDSIPEVQAFLQHAFSLIDLAIENYTARGFTNLMVSFGCTGGQHRSVYCAERLRERLAMRSVAVELVHVELLGES